MSKSLPRYRDLPIEPGRPPKTAWGMFGTDDNHFLLGRFGIAIGEMFVLDALADDCARDGRCAGLLTSAPLNVPGGTGTPANALFIK